MSRPLLGAVALALAGCASDTLSEEPGTVQVQAPAGKCWSGAIGNSTKEGCGSKSYEITGESIIVANAQKMTPGRWRLVLRLVMDGKVTDAAATTASYGVAQVSE
jgi:hypothetical protein